MFNKDYSHFLLSALGALLFSATVVSAAVGPARLVETAPLSYAQAAMPATDVANG